MVLFLYFIGAQIRLRNLFIDDTFLPLMNIERLLFIVISLRECQFFRLAQHSQGARDVGT